MALVKVVGNNRLDQNLNGDSFTNTASQTIFQFGGYNVTSNFSGRKFINYSDVLSTFVRPITLETLNFSNVESTQIFNKTENVVLNLDKSDLNTFIKFGSAYEFLRVSIQNIVLNFPYSLYVNSQYSGPINTTFYDFNFDEISNTSTFKIPTTFIENKYDLVFNQGNLSTPNDNQLKNLNISYGKYVVWSKYDETDNSHTITEFTGDSSSRDYLMVKCVGNPFPFISGDTFGKFDIHLKPNNQEFNDFRIQLEDFERKIVSERNGIKGFEFTLKEPFLLENGTIKYNDKNILWNTSDGYNINIDNSRYDTFLEIVLTIGNKYDKIKTDLIARFLTPDSIKTYDLTEEGKITKMLRIYGREFDQIKQFIDSLVYVNKVSYNKKNNLPDQIVKNLAKTFGWEHFQLVNEEQLVDKLLSNTEEERNLNVDLTPAEVDVELWRRILVNTNHFWKGKGTREAIKSMFLLIGIPEPFINITEYVYTIDGSIDPRTVELSINDLPSTTLPYNNLGYPIAPKETDDFYFQMSGDLDNGQAYMDVFRNVGFTLNQIVDNKKSWIYSDSAITRSHYSTRNYHQESSDLLLNTKEVDIALDISRGIEYDVYKYIKEIDFPANSSGYTIPYNFINLSVGIDSSAQYEFELPFDLGDPQGDVEVRYNGVLLIGPKYMTTGGTGDLVVISGNTNVDYYFTSSRNFIIPSLSGSTYDLNTSGPQRDVIEATYINSNPNSSVTGITVSYVVVRVNPDLTGTKIPLPEKPNGDVQLTINGVAATKGTNLLQGDYILDPNNSEQLIIQNPDLISFFATNPYTQITFITVTGSTTIEARNETTRVDSLYSGKVYLNNNANKFVYKLNYRISNPQNVKILVDGIALEPNTDYTINPTNPYELFLPAGINLGSVITAYYIVAGDDVFNPIVGSAFNVGDITEMSFLEFIEEIQKKLINATNRKVITDFKGGWYPTLYKIYTTYLKREILDDDNLLKSNGYTFQNLYPFLSKYNAFFKRFVDQLLSPTIILKKSGLLVRNTLFTKQKFTYKRGVSFDNGEGIITPLNYFGDDGSVFLKRPLEQVVDWSDDDVQILGLCDNFSVDNVIISYPETTTTTTQAPFNPTLFIDEVYYEVESLDNGSESYKDFELRFEPIIPPSYTVQIKLNYIIEIETFEDDEPVSAVGEITIEKNNVGIFAVQESEYSDSGGLLTFTGETSFDIEFGESIKMLLVNNAFAGGSSTSSSKTTITPTITAILPNGSELIITPSSVENYITF